MNIEYKDQQPYWGQMHWLFGYKVVSVNHTYTKVTVAYRNKDASNIFLY